MRLSLTLTLAIASALAALPAAAVTIVNADQARAHVFVCDSQCGPSFGDTWGSARDFWLDPGAQQSVDCAGECFVGVYDGDKSPTLGDMAMADEDELFQGNETGYIQGKFASHSRK